MTPNEPLWFNARLRSYACAGASLDADLSRFKVAKAECYLRVDRHRLLAVIENAFADHESFDLRVKDIVQARRGRALVQAPASRTRLMTRARKGLQQQQQQLGVHKHNPSGHTPIVV